MNKVYLRPKKSNSNRSNFSQSGEKLKKLSCLLKKAPSLPAMQKTSTEYSPPKIDTKLTGHPKIAYHCNL